MHCNGGAQKAGRKEVKSGRNFTKSGIRSRQCGSIRVLGQSSSATGNDNICISVITVEVKYCRKAKNLMANTFICIFTFFYFTKGVVRKCTLNAHIDGRKIRGREGGGWCISLLLLAWGTPSRGSCQWLNIATNVGRAKCLLLSHWANNRFTGSRLDAKRKLVCINQARKDNLFSTFKFRTQTFYCF